MYNEINLFQQEMGSEGTSEVYEDGQIVVNQGILKMAEDHEGFNNIVERAQRNPKDSINVLNLEAFKRKETINKLNSERSKEKSQSMPSHQLE